MPLNLLLKQKALEAGFDIAGIAPVNIWQDLDFARRWVEEGYGGEMHYLQNPKRHDPRRVLASARSVVCVGLIYSAPFPYSTDVKQVAGAEVTQSKSANSRQDDVPRAWISRYAWGQDYHEMMRAKLETLRRAIEQLAPGTETRVYVDTGPVVERAFARYSGMGWTGKNTCLINPSTGSWFFLGVILTSLEIEPDLPAPDRCGSCTRCLDACPTGALNKPYVMDASRCIAYFNIELKDSIPEQFRSQIGSNIFGCDICQDVCPWNRSRSTAIPEAKGFGRAGAATTNLPEFQPLEVTLSASVEKPSESAGNSYTASETSNDFSRSRVRSFSLFNPPIEALEQLSEEDFRRAFEDSPIKRPKYRGWLRNLCVVMGNSGDRRFIPKLQELSRHKDPIVREHAVWALRRLETTATQA